MMPGQNGYELTKEIKNQIKVPIILLTAKGEVENRIKGLEIGAEDYIGKPFEPKELLLRIRNVIKNRIPVSLILSIASPNHWKNHAIAGAFVEIVLNGT